MKLACQSVVQNGVCPRDDGLHVPPHVRQSRELFSVIRGHMLRSLVIGICCCCCDVVSPAPPLNFENPPINYSQGTPHNAVSRLQTALDSGETTLPFADRNGYLPAALNKLNVPENSQMLTFLKSSLQRPLIEPQNARAVYFGDDAYVASVPGGIIEVIVTDPHLGMVFYTLEQDPNQPMFQRQVSRCMTCHSSSRTKNIPGLQVRSMLTDPEGRPVISAGSFRTDQSSPLSRRWGGWFVTGTHGATQHLGNFQLPDKQRPRQPVDNSAGANCTDLSSLTDVTKHLSPHSDIVALMVFEHQIDAHNLMTRTNYAWQLKADVDDDSETESRWRQEADKLVEHLLFANEHVLEHPIAGTSSFAADFAAQGPFDENARSLRQFDLQTRMFAYPCSYMLHSDMFAGLPAPVRDYVFERLHTVLMSSTDESDETFAHLSDEDRTSLLQILPSVVAGLEKGWLERNMP